MKILVIDQVFYPENFRINKVVQNLVKFGHDVTVLTGYPNYPKGDFFDGYGPGIPYNEDYFGAKIVRVRIKPRKTGKVNLAKNYWSFWHSAKKWVRKNAEGFDVTYSCQLSPIFMCFPNITAKRKFKIPTVLNVQDLWPESFECVMGIYNKLLIKPLEIMSNYVYKNADMLLCSSNSFVENMKKRGINNDKLMFWPQFSESYDLSQLDCPIEYNTKYRFVFAGNIGEAQGLDVVLDSAKLTINNKDIGYYIIGDGSDKKRLKEITNKHSLTNIVFIESKPEKEIPAYLVNATASLLTLKENILSKTVIPAKMQMYMACGSPILTTIKGEAGFIVEEASCGWVCKENDGESLANTINDIICLDDSVYQSIKHNALDYNKRFFNEYKLMQILDKVLYEVVNK